MKTKNENIIMNEFLIRQRRQIFAIAITLLLIVLLAVVYKHPDIFGEYTGHTISVAQLVVIVAFINFTALNWRCPACKKYLGRDINKRICRHCRTSLHE
ncbi:MAG: hypothetical protein ISR96_02105 [Nitrospira sp.]|nr:hypothetical protein [bacterium]MBL7048310.1 hypothetical protein [Nitrospira sp.]